MMQNFDLEDLSHVQSRRISCSSGNGFWLVYEDLSIDFGRRNKHPKSRYGVQTRVAGSSWARNYSLSISLRNFRWTYPCHICYTIFNWFDCDDQGKLSQFKLEYYRLAYLITALSTQLSEAKQQKTSTQNYSDQELLNILTTRILRRMLNEYHFTLRTTVFEGNDDSL